MSCETAPIRRSSPLPKAIFFAFIPEISLRRAQIDNLGATVAVLLHLSALFAIVRIADALVAADSAAALEAAEIALVADLDEGARPHIGVANDALAVALLAEAPNGHSRLLPAENKIRMVLCHASYFVEYYFLLSASSRKLDR